jgi:hypothetical protein
MASRPGGCGSLCDPHSPSFQTFAMLAKAEGYHHSLIHLDLINVHIVVTHLAQHLDRKLTRF